MNLQVKQRIPLKIKRMGINGEGIGFYKKTLVFVPGALKGEEVFCQVVSVKRNFVQAKLLKINKKEVIETLKIDQYTLDDIIDCLIKPNRSIRDQYQTPLLKKDILHIEDLKPGMVLEGTVRNVVDFGAFVDIGLKNDGLVHISKMSKQRIKHPLDVLSIGDIVEVNVIDVDLNKKRVSLSMI